jgi:hypothetical protein
MDKALVTTRTKEKAMAAAAITELRSQQKENIKFQQQ